MLSELVGGEQMITSSPEIMAALRKWFESHKVHIDLGNGKKGMVTPEGFSGDIEGEPAE